jgi:hypothetical protein
VVCRPQVVFLASIALSCGRVDIERIPQGDFDAGPRDAGEDARAIDGGPDAGRDASVPIGIDSIEPEESITGNVWASPLAIRGEGFRAGMTASIGGADCESTVFVSENELACTRVGALPIGALDVEVRSAGESASLPGAFLSLGQPSVWLRADAIALADGAPVARWDDASGFGNHALQATANRRPSLRLDAVGGRPAVLFGDADGTFDFLDMVDSPSLRPTAITIVAVAEMTRITRFAKVVSRTYRSDGSHSTPFQSYSMGFSHEATGSPYFDFATPSGLSVAIHDGSALGSFGIAFGVYEGTTASMFYGGDATGPSNNRAATGPIDYTGMTVDVSIGIRSRYTPEEALVGSIAEILIYDRGVDAAERGEISAYLSRRYGL